FESNLFQEMCKLFGIEKTRTTPYHPQSDGMVERFNRTLATMLTAYVSSNQRDWDNQLPYVTMAYRSAEHETTGMSPNMLMLGREVSTPLDLMFELPNLSKPIPNNQWVWELRDRIETAHTLVRKYTQQAMHRQKRFRDLRTSYETFNKGDQVFVYFPVKKVGTSAKLTPFWRGPFQITEKLSDILYKVNCGYNRTEQVIHCDRIRLCRQQILRGEIDQADDNVQSKEPEINDEVIKSTNDDTDEIEEVIEQSEIHTDSEVDLDGKRVRKRPFWAKDYVFSCRMPNLKQTPRKQSSVTELPKTRCTWCKGLFESGDTFEKHIVLCYRNRWSCRQCGKTFAKKAYLEKHRITQHNVKTVNSLAKKMKTATCAFSASQKVKSVDQTESIVKVRSDKGDSGDQEKVKVDSELTELNDKGKDRTEVERKVKKAESLTLRSEEISDWDVSPDVSVAGDLQLSDESDESSDKDSVSSVQISKEKEDKDQVEVLKEEVRVGAEQNKRNVSDKSISLLKGRLFRKATEPIKPIAPQKRKREDTVRSEKVMSAPTQADKPGPSSVNETKKKDMKEFKVRCVKNDASEQETIVTEENEIIYRNVLTNKRQKKESVEIDLGELLPEGDINTGNIKLRLVKGSEIELKLAYCPTDD
ncbi:MAG: hypothetical protein AB2693_30530, partial [Candidatus Thiodiazotropha sp.]